MTEFLMIVLKLAIIVMIVAVGAVTSWTDPPYLWRRPGLLARSMVAMYVLC
jgi:bile acid:Na+ symporter, BASS family